MLQFKESKAEFSANVWGQVTAFLPGLKKKKSNC